VMNDIHNKARKRRQQLLQASQEARSRAVDVLEVLGTLTLDEAIPDPGLRSEIIQRYPREELRFGLHRSGQYAKRGMLQYCCLCFLSDVLCHLQGLAGLVGSRATGQAEILRLGAAF
jgi:hypothetical protein